MPSRRSWWTRRCPSSERKGASMASEIKVPALGESVTEATVARWLKKPGEAVAMDDPLVELETDKVTLEVNAPAAGVLSEIVAPEGANVAVGTVLGRIGEGAAKPAAPAKAQPAAAVAPSEAKKPAAAAAAVGNVAVLERSGPAARKLVEENQLDPAKIAATGKDGRLTKGDVLTYMERGAPTTAAKPAPAARPPRELAPMEERVRMTRLRRRIAERLKEAQSTAAMLTTFNEADMSAIMALREQHRDSFEKKYGVRLGFMSFFVKACI